MSNKNTSGGVGGIGLSTVLTLIFVVLKLIGAINWSWIWVLSPIWIGIALWLLVVIIGVIYICHDIKKSQRGKDKWKF